MRVISLIAILLMPCLVWAQTSPDDFTRCDGTAVPSGDSIQVDDDQNWCMEFDSGFGVAASRRFSARLNFTTCIDPNRNASGASGAAVVDVQWCGIDAASDNACVDTGLTLTGSNPCEAFLRGLYRFNVTTAPTGAEDAVIVIRGY